jgi:hypothetical protein
MSWVGALGQVERGGHPQKGGLRVAAPAFCLAGVAGGGAPLW